MNLERRIQRMEAEVKPAELRGVIQGFLADSAPPKGSFATAGLDWDDPRLLPQGVDGDGEAIIPLWAVTFFDGTREQQEARPKNLERTRDFQTVDGG
jgi:hypothetical protein